ncbi:MAG: MBL fold metallo-hydrolase RNA specificity domain-containing protein [Nanobdellota archaeon]
MIEIRTIGGYGEVGKNCTAIRIDDDVILMDMGVHLENYINHTEDEDIRNISADELIDSKAIPDIDRLGDWTGKVKAIVPTHAHLDHIGAVPFLSNEFEADILCTPFTKEVLEEILRNESIGLKNDIKSVNVNSSQRINKNLGIEFINITHSTPQTAIAVLHTPYGAVVYANDFKIDNFPTHGQRPNLERLKEIREKEGVKALIVDSLYADSPRKTPSEEVARTMLKDVLLSVESEEKGIIITTFSSHIARLRSIVQLAKEVNRKVFFIGRSLSKYINAAKEAGIAEFTENTEMVKYGKQIRKKLKNIDKKNSIIVCTGHQGEKKAVLNRIAQEELEFNFEKDDIVIFSCNVIPTLMNQENREELENSLRDRGARIFRDIHVSGHGSREDLRDMLNLLRPDNIIPAHSNLEKAGFMADLADEMGFKNTILLKNDQSVSLDPEQNQDLS